MLPSKGNRSTLSPPHLQTSHLFRPNSNAFFRLYRRGDSCGAALTASSSEPVLIRCPRHRIHSIHSFNHGGVVACAIAVGVDVGVGGLPHGRDDRSFVAFGLGVGSPVDALAVMQRDRSLVLLWLQFLYPLPMFRNMSLDGVTGSGPLFQHLVSTSGIVFRSS